MHHPFNQLAAASRIVFGSNRIIFAIRRNDNLYWEGSLSKSPDKWGSTHPHFYTTKFQAARSIKMKNIDPDIVVVDVFDLRPSNVIMICVNWLIT
jgi:hypothetical protein